MSKIGLEAAQGIWRAMVGTTSFDSVLTKASVVSFSGTKCSTQLQVEEEHADHKGMLHSGFASTLIDLTSQLVFMGSDLGMPAVSTELSMSFLKPAAVGDVIRADAECLNVNGKLVCARVDIRRVGDEALVASALHTGYSIFANY